MHKCRALQSILSNSLIGGSALIGLHFKLLQDCEERMSPPLNLAIQFCICYLTLNYYVLYCFEFVNIFMIHTRNKEYYINYYIITNSVIPYNQNLIYETLKIWRICMFSNCYLIFYRVRCCNYIQENKSDVYM